MQGNHPMEVLERKKKEIAMSLDMKKGEAALVMEACIQTKPPQFTLSLRQGDI